MRLVFGLLALTAACGDDGNMFPVGGSGNDGGFQLPDGGGGGGGGADAARDGGADATPLLVDAALFDGRVCLLTDVRDFETCATTGAGGLTVRLGTATTTTAADGRFTIAAQTGGGLVWRVTGPGIVSSYETVADYFIPAITKAKFDAMRMASADPDVGLAPGEGSMMVFVSRNAAGVSGVTATTDPEAFYKPYYDSAGTGAAETTFNQTGTNGFGIVWVPGLDVGTASITVKDALSEGTISGPIFDGGITFANIILP